MQSIAVLLLCLFIPLLSRDCFGMLSESNEIGNLLMDKQRVIFEFTLPCIDKCQRDAAKPSKEIIQLSASKTCQISNSAPGREPSRVMVHDDKEKNVNIGTLSPPTDLGLRAMLLYQFENTVSYMILDPKQAHWLFTNELSGCDIFIATNDAQPDMPMVFHANVNELYKTEQQVDNLLWKGAKVDGILSAFHNNYVLKVRIHVTPQEPKPAHYDEYWQSYNTDHQNRVKVYPYDYNDDLEYPQTQFYGYYDKGWKFFVKAKETGVKKDILV